MEDEHGIGRLLGMSDGHNLLDLTVISCEAKRNWGSQIQDGWTGQLTPIGANPIVMSDLRLDFLSHRRVVLFASWLILGDFAIT